VSPTQQKRLTAVLALLIAGAALAYLAMSNVEENLVYYWTPTDLLAKASTVKDATIRLGGMVKVDSKEWNAETLSLKFIMSESPVGDGPSITVVSTGAPPQMFREGIGCIVEGKYDGKLFHADRLMVKHSNEYRPPKEGEDAHDMYKTMDEDEMPADHPQRKRRDTESPAPMPSTEPKEERL